VNYAREVAAARLRRDATIQRAREETSCRIAAAAVERDELIRQLHVVDGLGPQAIAVEVGCSVSTVFEVLRPDKHEAYKRRRRAHWHVYRQTAGQGRAA
jgi:hypothetical protein